MELKKIFFILLFCIAFITVFFCFLHRRCSQGHQVHSLCPSMTIQEVVALFPASVDAINKQKKRALQGALQAVTKITSVKSQDRTFENAVRAFDTILRDLKPLRGVLYTLINLHSDKKLREHALGAIIEIKKFMIDTIWANKGLYNAIKSYASNNAKRENLTAIQKYVLQEMLDDFERSGLGLPDKDFVQVKKLKKELVALRAQYKENMRADERCILVKESQLSGLDKQFIDTLGMSEGSLRKVGIDRPTYARVMKYCDNRAVRERLYKERVNRAYPQNDSVLKSIIAKRDQFARLLGYNSFAQFDCDRQMLNSPEKVEHFIESLHMFAQKKAQKELALFISKLKDDVILMQDGKLFPWDVKYIRTLYRKKCFDIDESKLYYLTIDQAVDAMIYICKKFFNLELSYLLDQSLWHKDVKVLQVKRLPDNTVIGYIFLDLLYRKGKYPGARHIRLLSGLLQKDSCVAPAAGTIVTNFSHFLQIKDVKTLFHEFGHALHSILSSTSNPLFYAMYTKSDFHEMPSQLIALFALEPEILRLFKHYKTKEALSKKAIKNIVKLPTINSGLFVLGQLYGSGLSLDMFKAGAHKDPKRIVKCNYEKYLMPLVYVSDNHMYTSFIYFMGYKAKYYSYIWSRVLALDVWGKIKKHGVLHSQVCKKYVAEILSKGGSVDPEVLLKNFLGRALNNKAFIKYYDLN